MGFEKVAGKMDAQKKCWKELKFLGLYGVDLGLLQQEF